MTFSSKCHSFGPIPIVKYYFKNFLHLFFVVCSLQSAQGEVQICQKVQPPVQGTEPENCSLVCSLKFHHAVSGTPTDELTLCVKNTSIAVFCIHHNDCRQYHVGAYCKTIPCLCQAKAGPPEAYIVDPFVGVHKINTCVVSSKYMNLDQSIVPFPWKTLLIVCAIVFVFATCLICVRWVTPILQSYHAKMVARNNRDRSSAPVREDNTSLFPVVSSQSTDSTPFTYYFQQGMPRIYRASPRRSHRNHRNSRARYTACAQTEATLSRTGANEDKPPPYETAIQLPPPAYEDVERAINERRMSANISQCNREQRVEVHATLENTEPPVQV